MSSVPDLALLWRMLSAWVYLHRPVRNATSPLGPYGNNLFDPGVRLHCLGCLHEARGIAQLDEPKIGRHFLCGLTGTSGSSAYLLARKDVWASRFLRLQVPLYHHLAPSFLRSFVPPLRDFEHCGLWTASTNLPSLTRLGFLQGNLCDGYPAVVLFQCFGR